MRTTGKMRVLVVDDDRRMVKTISDILKIKGYETAEAYTGEEAVEEVTADRPDCVLMDMKMPGMNGAEALKRIKALSPDLPVVLMSAYATEALVEEAKREGAWTVLNKPLDLQAVLSFLGMLSKEESILVVDDDAAFCRTLRDILESRGYRVETEDNPGRVLAHMEKDYKLVVVLDLKLGNTDGLDVLKAIRARYPTKPVVLVTGYKDEMSGSIQKGLRIGAFTCLYKPLEIEALVSSIKEISVRKLQAVLGEPFERREESVGESWTSRSY